jgi:hypothetical protein
MFDADDFRGDLLAAERKDGIEAAEYAGEPRIVRCQLPVRIDGGDLFISMALIYRAGLAAICMSGASWLNSG